MSPPEITENPYATPTSALAEAPVVGPGHAGRGTRLAAALVDGVLFAAVFALGFALPATTRSPEAGQWGLILVLLGFVGLIVVNAVLLGRNGQTIAKYWFRIRVARPDGSNPGLARIFLARYLPVTVLSLVPLVGGLVSLVDALMIFRDNHRCLHDEIADTVVVKA
jgi:uncharacterized RDD family membrane protein YckC